jgi:hypothetical protein
MTSQEIMGNIAHLYHTYGKKNISTDKRLLLLYWRDIDEVEMDKEHFSTADWLMKSTDPIVIIHGKMMLESIWESDGK